LQPSFDFYSWVSSDCNYICYGNMNEPVIGHSHYTQICDLVCFDSRAVHAINNSGSLRLLVRDQPRPCTGVSFTTGISTFENSFLADPAGL
jgi:hypothetical protein